jgi:hypothetical protein
MFVITNQEAVGISGQGSFTECVEQIKKSE